MHEFSGTQLAILGALLTFFATWMGALPIIFIRNISDATKDLFMGLSAGIMLAATAFSLIEPAVELFSKSYSKLDAALFGGLMILLGGLVLHLANEHIPHEHFTQGRQGRSSVELKQIWLFVLAITIHNIPEGLAVGTALGSQDLSLGLPVAFGISLQDIPEGLVVALALRSQKYSIKESFFVAGVTGLVEAIGALVGFYAIITVQTLLPWTLAFAGGMMLYVISHEMIPEGHRSGHAKQSTAGLMIGFVVMMLMDVLLK